MTSLGNPKILHDPALTTSHRRIEYPTIDTAIVKNFRNWGSGKPYPLVNPVEEEARLLIEEQVSKCDPSTPLGDDHAIFEEIVFQKVHEPDYANLLKTLYWRGRVQMAVFDVFTVLCIRGLVNPECLRLPMTFYLAPTDVGSLAGLLGCYKGPQKERHIEPMPFRFHGDLFASPLMWLATMILRGCYDIKRTIETVTACRFLGDVDDDAVAEWNQWTLVKNFTIDKNTLATESIGDCEFGFWLPHGIGMVNDEGFAARVRQQVNVFNRIEKTFQVFFNVALDEISVESEQVDFFERAGRKMLELKRSGDWAAVFNLGASTSSASSGPASSQPTAPTSGFSLEREAGSPRSG
ncbi:MAG: hypothetical protein L6R40_003586 [Gallowayella cf. fulva]|nr:MAG: hypothetical protein L6R40_003586 [Xanthomendoza cf. fulva]